MAAAVCWQRSRGLLTMASSGSGASRAASARAWAAPRSSSPIPGVQPDRVRPVAAVSPWRTSRTVVTCSTLALTHADDEHGRAEHHMVTGVHRHGLADPPAVDPGPVGGSGVGQDPAAVDPVQAGVVAGHGGVLNEQVAPAVPADDEAGRRVRA